MSHKSLLQFILIMMLLLQACAAGGTQADDARVHSQLPTLTSTPLPTLTPTSAAPSVAAAETNATAMVQAANPTVPAPPPAALSQEAAPTPVPQAVVADPATTPIEATPIAEVAGPAPPPEAAPPVEAANEATGPSPIDAPLPTDIPLPTNTPLPADTPIPTSTETPTETPTATPTATDVPTETPSPTPAPWAFGQIFIYNDEGYLTLYGKVTNQTGVPQELRAIEGALLDDQGQVMAGLGEIEAYWPGYVIPAGAAVPFEFTGEGDQENGDFQGSVEAESRDEAPRQDFEFTGVEVDEGDGEYCVSGEVKNRGDSLSDYLLLILTLYNPEEQVVGFTEYEEYAPDWVEGDDGLEFLLCAYPLADPVGRYELQALGQ